MLGFFVSGALTLPGSWDRGACHGICIGCCPEASSEQANNNMGSLRSINILFKVVLMSRMNLWFGWTR